MKDYKHADPRSYKPEYTTPQFFKALRELAFFAVCLIAVVLMPVLLEIVWPW